mmetsp:Transcript_67091/g.216379  ORF Transcript_67091/g.216379 Transcript_67091/m.216379 type:complete len:268 (+) Transcript_67091:763-1566(+)
MQQGLLREAPDVRAAALDNRSVDPPLLLVAPVDVEGVDGDARGHPGLRIGVPGVGPCVDLRWAQRVPGCDADCVLPEDRVVRRLRGPGDLVAREVQVTYTVDGKPLGTVTLDCSMPAADCLEQTVVSGAQLVPPDDVVWWIRNEQSSVLLIHGNASGAGNLANDQGPPDVVRQVAICNLPQIWKGGNEVFPRGLRAGRCDGILADNGGGPGSELRVGARRRQRLQPTCQRGCEQEEASSAPSSHHSATPRIQSPFAGNSRKWARLRQ